MSTINWTAGLSGNWTTASDWSGGVVPGPNDIAQIAGMTSSLYTITLDTPVTVAGLILDQAYATLDVSGTLASQDMQLTSGHLLLDDGTLSGTVTDKGGHQLMLAVGNSTLDNVTWRGPLDPSFIKARAGMPGSTLTINHGLDLVGASGRGPGNAKLAGTVTLEGVATLDNATIYAETVQVVNSPTLTLGSGLIFGSANGRTNADILLTKNETLINDGTFDNTGVNGQSPHSLMQSPSGTFINNGRIDVGVYQALARYTASSVTNNGTISVESGIAINLQTWQKPGDGATILLNGGVVEWDSSTAVTTAQLLTLDATQNVVSTGNYGFGVETLNNIGTNLDVGSGTTLGELMGEGATHITGGTITTHGMMPIISGSTLQSLDLVSSAPTLALDSSTLTGVMVTGASELAGYGFSTTTFNGGTLSGVGSLSILGIVLNGVTITGANNDGVVSFGNSGDSQTITVTSNQSVKGYDFNLIGGSLILGPGASTTGASISATDFATILVGASDGSLSSTISANTPVTANSELVVAGGSSAAPFDLLGTITSSSTIDVGGDLSPHNEPAYINNSGDITAEQFIVSYYPTPSGMLTNSGTIAVTGGYLQLSPSRLVNTGTISVTNGTLVLIGPLTLASLGEISHPSSQLFVSGQLDLGGQSVTVGKGGTPDFGLQGGDPQGTSISDGTLTVAAGTNFLSDGGTISAAFVNNGVVSVGNLDLNGPVSGTGSFTLANQTTLTVDTQIGVGATVQFLDGNYDELAFGNTTDAQGFKAEIGGFAVNDKIGFLGGSETLTAGHFSGHSIVATFSNGNTIALATTAALTGTLYVNYDELIYGSAANVPASDWSTSHQASNVQVARSAEILHASGHAHLPEAALNWPPHYVF